MLTKKDCPQMAAATIVIHSVMGLYFSRWRHRKTHLIYYGIVYSLLIESVIKTPQNISKSQNKSEITQPAVTLQLHM